MDAAGEVVSLNPIIDAAGPFEKYGPWALLCVIIIFAVGVAAWKIYSRMAGALDKQHENTLVMAREHSTAIERLHTQTIAVVDNNTKVVTVISERMTGVENRLGAVEKAVDKIQN